MSLLRRYAVVATLLLFLLLPMGIARIGTTRHARVVVAYTPARNGSVTATWLGRRIEVQTVSINGDRPVAGGSLAFIRQVQSLPAGTALDYVTNAGMIHDVVTEAPASAEEVVTRTMAIVIATTFAIFGLGIALAASDRRALIAAAALSGVALLFAPMFLISTTSSIQSDSLRGFALALWMTFPRALALYWMPLFASVFPRPLPRRSSWPRFFLNLTLMLTLALTFVESVNQISLITDHVSLALQHALLLTGALLQRAAYALSLIGTLVVIRAQAAGRKSLAASDATRLDVLWTALLVGFGFPSAVAILQATLRLIFHANVIPSAFMLMLLAPMLIVPPAVAYSTRARRVDSVRLLVRRAVLFAFTRRAVQAALWIPIVIAGAIVYQHRHEPFVAILASHPIVFMTAFLTFVISVRFTDAIHGRIESFFFRDRVDARAVLAALVERIGETRTTEETAEMLEAEIERALHLESIAFFTREPVTERFRARGVPWFLESFSIVVEALQRVESALDVDAHRSPIGNASELERLWIDEASIRLLVPLRINGDVIAFLALGEKRSELPFDRSDRLLLQTVASSASLVLENQRLRASAPQHLEVIEDDVTVVPACYCSQCRRISESGAGTCEHDGTSLMAAGIPSLVCGKYRLESYVGSGGMGVVFRARDLTLGRTVAIKTLPQLSAQAASRFQREARLGAALTHPALAVVFAAETWNGRPLLVMEYLAHGTLSTRLHSTMPLDEWMDCAVRLADALAALHEAGVMHRDVKPSNIGFASPREAKLLDFGLARIVADSSIARVVKAMDEAPRSRETSGIIGTPAYLPPEALLGKSDGVAVDLWGLSMSLYEAAAGTHPFRDSDAVRVMNRIVSEEVPDVRRRRPDVPARIADLLAASLSRDRSLRPRDARSLARAFRDAIS